MDEDLMGETVFFINDNKICRDFVVKIISTRSLNTGSVLHGKEMPIERLYYVNGLNNSLTRDRIFTSKEELINSVD